MKGKHLRISGTVLFLSAFVLLLFCRESAFSATIYIDPTYAGGGSDGSITKPFLSWTSVTAFQDYNVYLQKRGTTCNIAGELYLFQKTGVSIGVYGAGTDYASIHKTGVKGAVIHFSSCRNCKVDGFHLSAPYNDPTYATYGVYVVDNENDNQNKSFVSSNVQILNCLIEQFTWGIRMMKFGRNAFDNVTVNNVIVRDIFFDGFFIQGWNPSNPLRGVDINHCTISKVNRAYDYYLAHGITPSESNSGGDGIQISQVVNGWKIHNTTIDRRGSSFKFCIIHNDELGTKTCGGTVENCILYAPDKGAGGLVSYLSSLSTVTFRYNKVYCSSVDRGIMTRYGTVLQCYYNTFSGTGTSVPQQVFDTGSGPVYIQNNTFYGASQVFKLTSGASTLNIYNNIFYTAGNVYSSLTGVSRSNNLYYKSTNTGSETNAILNLDPKFVNPASGDYHLLSGSPAIDKGKNLGYTVDIAGVAVPQSAAPDIGAYEKVVTVSGLSVTGLETIEDTSVIWEKLALKVYPNPAGKSFTIVLQQPATIQITDMKGEK